MIPQVLRDHFHVLRKGTRGTETLGGLDVSTTTQFFANRLVQWKNLVDKRVYFRYFDLLLMNGWFDSIKGYLLREAMTICSMYGPHLAEGRVRREDIGDEEGNVPIELVVDTGSDGPSYNSSDLVPLARLPEDERVFTQVAASML